MLAVRKNDLFHEMIKENGFLSCTCDGQCKSTPEVVFNNDGVCAPVEVKEKKGFVAKLLAFKSRPKSSATSTPASVPSQKTGTSKLCLMKSSRIL